MRTLEPVPAVKAGRPKLLAEAACRDDPRLFDDSDHAAIPRRARQAAFQFCRTCPVFTECTDEALRLGVGATGVWAGTYRHALNNGKGPLAEPVDLLGSTVETGAA